MSRGPDIRTAAHAMAAVSNRQTFLFSDTASASLGSFCGSAPRYGTAEDVGVVPVVIPELKFRDVKREILLGDVVECAENAALQERPEPVNGLRVNDPTDILTSTMEHRVVLEPLASQAGIQGALVRCDEVNLLGHGLFDEAFGNALVDALDGAGNEGALAADSAHDGELVGDAATFHLVHGMPVFVLSADIGLINLHDADQLAEVRITQSGADAVAHIVRGLVGAEAHHALHFKCGHAFLAGQHHVDDLEPVAEADLRVLERCGNQNREAIPGTGACAAFPGERDRLGGPDARITATRAPNAFRPATGGQIRFAGIVGREQFIELSGRHLLGELLGHRSGPRV